jgi:tRNA/tmRNA/rRNA uracil-C5-methylase (TrmA/RlmC/RlmD family)
MRSKNVTSVTITDGMDCSGDRPAPESGEVARSADRPGPVPGEAARASDLLAPGDVAELRAGEAAHGGWCVARLGGTGPVVFVRHALPGERVRARITEVTARFARADAIEILEPSADRVEPPCPYARPGGCGGCDWQHASLPAQRELKASVVRQQLRRIAGIDWPVTVEALPGDEGPAVHGTAGRPGDDAGDPPGDDAGDPASGRTGDAPAAGLGWRTRVTFAVRGDGVAGLRAHRSHEVINVADCLIAHPRIRDLGIPARRWPRLATLEAVVATDNGERAVIASGASRSVPLTQITAESVLAAGRHHRPGGTVLRGHAHLRQRAAGRSWRVSAGGFWQVHPAAASTLAGAVLDALRPRPGDAVLDLYCGAGLFAGVLADAVGPGGTVAGVEASTAAARDARRNLRPMPWAAVYQGDVGEVIARGVLPPARLAVLDPPRAGAARDVIDYLATGPGPAGREDSPRDGSGDRCGDGSGDGSGADGERRIAYVSCDPATLARDIALFAGHGWRLEALRTFDAFPMTHHVECLATLVRGAAPAR